MRWLERELQKSYQYKFVFIHVSPFDSRIGSKQCLSDWVDRFFFNIWAYINGFWVTHKLVIIALVIIIILLGDIISLKLNLLSKNLALRKRNKTSEKD